MIFLSLKFFKMVLHEQVWMIAATDPNSDFAEIEIVYSLFRILLDPARLTIKEAANIIKEFLEKLGRNSNQKRQVIICIPRNALQK